MKKHEKKSKFFDFLHKISIVLFIGLIVLVIVSAISNDAFSSEEALKAYIESAGNFAPLLFIFLQTLTVLIIVLPSGLGYAVGTLLFGPWMSLLLNVICTVLGSLIIYYCVKKWGNKFLESFVPEDKLNKYRDFLNNEKNYKRFKRLFCLMIFLPFAPDNVLCYIVGTTKMSFKEYCKLIILFKPWQLLLFCFGLDKLMTFIPW